MTSRKVAFIGRSNVGKSSLINALLNKGEVAKVSSRPGKTRRIEEYDFSTKIKLVDMPGYGFARARGEIRQNWDENLLKLFFDDDLLQNIFVLIDSSIKPMKIDQDFLLWCQAHNLPHSIIFTKIDKENLKNRSAIKKEWLAFLKVAGEDYLELHLQKMAEVSVKKKTGLGELKNFINTF